MRISEKDFKAYSSIVDEQLRLVAEEPIRIGTLSLLCRHIHKLMYGRICIMKQLEQDYYEVSQSNIEFEKIKNKTFLVTGATGLIGSLFIKNLLYCNDLYDLNLKILAIARNQNKAEKVFGEAFKKGRISFYFRDIIDSYCDIIENIDYILHTASITNSKRMVSEPIETLETAFLGTRNILDLAVHKNARIIYLSSMEVYGQVSVIDRDVVERDLGYIDLTKVRSDYCESKRVCEVLCTAYYSKYGTDVITARLAQTFGAGILPGENRVFAQFARSVIQEKNIILHTLGDSEGNYCYTSDAIIAILLLFLKGEIANTYNVSNESCHSTIANMAKLVVDNFSTGKSKIVFDIPKSLETYGYAPSVKMKLSSQKLKSLGWQANVDLCEAYRRLICYMKDHPDRVE